jgi:hypothetical protein
MYPGQGILALFPSATPFGLALGADSPWEDELYPGNLRLTVGGILTRLFTTHASILIWNTSNRPRDLSSQAYPTLPYHLCPKA